MGESSPSHNLTFTIKGFEDLYQHFELGPETNGSCQSSSPTVPKHLEPPRPLLSALIAASEPSPREVLNRPHYDNG